MKQQTVALRFRDKVLPDPPEKILDMARKKLRKSVREKATLMSITAGGDWELLPIDTTDLRTWPAKPYEKFIWDGTLEVEFAIDG